MAPTAENEKGLAIIRRIRMHIGSNHAPDALSTAAGLILEEKRLRLAKVAAKTNPRSKYFSPRPLLR